MTDPLQDLVGLADEDDTSPCSLTAFMKQFARDVNFEHAGFMEELRAPLSMVLPASHIMAGASVYSDLRNGVRELAWIPAGIGIMEHLDPFFIRWQTPKGVETLLHNYDHRLADQVDASLRTDKSTQTWVVSWPLENTTNDDSPEPRKNQSGFRLKINHPDVVVVSFMIARAIFRKQNVPFASCADHLRFAITGTRVGADHRIAVAYVPNRAVYYQAFSIGDDRKDLVDSGLVLISSV
jgi:hypothetical protein